MKEKEFENSLQVADFFKPQIYKDLISPSVANAFIYTL